MRPDLHSTVSLAHKNKVSTPVEEIAVDLLRQSIAS